MKTEWLQIAILRAASLLAPAGRRAEWLADWRSELWYISRRRATRFCLGAFRDAMWVRRNSRGPGRRTAARLESPVAFIALLAALAAAVMLAGAALPVARKGWPPLPSCGWMAELQAVCLLLWTAASLALPQVRPPRWACALRRWLFLAAKIALVLPVLPCAMLLMAAAGPLPMSSHMFLAACILAFRWVYLDQRRRCPVCLRLLTASVRIGSPSRTFLEWYGAESMCPRGHGLLHAPGTEAGFCGKRRWLHLDPSWSGLFPRAAGAWK